MCAKYYENPTMLSRVTAKNVGDVFLRHTVLWKPKKKLGRKRSGKNEF